MSGQSANQIKEGLWTQNPALVQMLGLCPLLAVSTTFSTALGLGLTTLAVLVLANGTISCIRHWLDDSTRLPAQILVIATLVTIADLLLASAFFELHQRIGLFVALIVTNCALLGRAESYARRSGLGAALLDGTAMGTGFLLAILIMGALREILGQGTLFAGMQSVMPTLHVAPSGILLFVLPPGAFFALGCLIAAKNAIDAAVSRPRGEDKRPQPREQIIPVRDLE